MVVPLLTTKLFLPPVRAERVQRERLLARLDEVLRPPAQLALISAPAGFGKTSLLAEWLAQRSRPAAWLALDAGDNTPDLFLSYLCAALGRARPGLAAQAAALLSAEPAPPLETLLAVLVNELSTLDPTNPLVIALDDFQFVTAQDVRAVITFLVEHLPPGARLVIATRSDPPLPLARLRARGQMVELRTADLRFNAEEAAVFLDRVMHLEHRPEVAEALSARTEGWAAGLQMAAVALRQSMGDDMDRFLSAFSGSHHFVLDYLAEEVLAHLPAETVRFLLQTAVLERFNAGLVAALIGESESPAEIQRCQAMLESLERANLFLIPLDGERQWFRYHHLFADLLHARLKESEPWLKQSGPGLEPNGPGQIALLHRRAAGWFERSGFIAEAIQHLLSAAAESLPADPASAESDYQQAAQLVENHTLALLRRGEMHALQAWVNLLPAHLVDRRPWLCINRAWIHAFAGQMEDVEPLLQKAVALSEAANDSRLLTEIEGHCAAVRAFMHLFGPNPGAVLDLARQAKEKLPEADWAWGLANWAQGYALRMAGHLDEANAIFTYQVRRARREGDPWGLAMGATDLSVVLRQQGRLRETLEMIRDTLAFLEDHGARQLGYTGRLLTALGSALYEQNDLPAARRWLEEAAALNALWRNPNHQVFAYLNLARVLIAQGEFEQAASRLDDAARVLRDLPVVASLSQSIEVLRFNLLLAQGKPLPAGGPLEGLLQAVLAQDPAQPLTEAREGQVLFAARVLLAQQRSAEALRLVSGIEEPARAAARTGALIDIHTFKAIAAYQAGSPAQALPDLKAALDLAAPEGALRSILNADLFAPGGLRQMLEALRRKGADPRAGAEPRMSMVDIGFVDQLLAALPGAAQASQLAPAASASAHTSQLERFSLLQPLSEREREVLQLMAAGLTNAQIAERLVITTGTVKAHTASIFRKLDALNRTQAVAKAREIGLV